jgi:Lipoprotein LpqB beta-propeller domain
VTRTAAVSPDGTQIALLTSNGKLMIYPANGGSGRVVPTASALGPLLWSGDDWLYVQHLGAYTQIPTRLSRFHLPTSRMEPWSELRPADTLGVNAITKVMVALDARTVVFNYRRALSELFVATPAAR